MTAAEAELGMTLSSISTSISSFEKNGSGSRSVTAVAAGLNSPRKAASVLTSVEFASRAVSPARRFLPASRNSFDQL
ncbi:hypothetical protein [Celeribacter litoreus]|uniref:hypothetical protein n=1 Tax=Celeribacter litoreus TaxID=2876714 RepID=UPI0037BFA477